MEIESGLEQAKTEGFNKSTFDELRIYCKSLGIKVEASTKSESMRRMLRNALGIVDVGFIPPSKKRVVPKNQILPPYGLSPDGKWGGRRHRIRVSRPADAGKDEAGFYIHCNGRLGGASGYPIAYGEVQVVPEPVFNRLRELERTDFQAVNEGGELVTEFKTTEKLYHVEYLGIDEETKDLCGSLHEWFSKFGSGWLAERSFREIKLIAAALDVEPHIRNPVTGDLKEASEDELRRRVCIFLHGYDEIEEAA